MRPERPRYRFLLGLARGAVLWENLWPRLWPASAVAALFLCLVFFDVLPRLPVAAHVILLLLFAVGFLAALIFGFSRVAIPLHRVARGRVERDSGLTHHPLAAIEDDLASGAGNEVSERLWAAHQERAARAARRLRVAVPRAGLARIDPWGLRAAVVLVLVIALAAGRDDPVDRLARALWPDFGGPQGNQLVVEVWLTPPAYTRAAPVFLERAADPDASPNAVPVEPRPVPAGTSLMAQVTGPKLQPVLQAGGQALPFEAVGERQTPQSFRLETTLESGDRLAVTAGDEVLAEWPIRVVPDAPPTVALTAPPEPTEQAYLRFGIEAEDDYGLSDVKATITRLDADGAATIELPLPLPTRAAKTLRSRPARDLSAHLWAGHPAELTVSATDISGQTARTEPVSFVLPERQFRHPVARAIVAERKKLIEPTDAVRAEVAAGLSLIGIAPHRFGQDVVVMLGLSLASGRLHHDNRAEAIDAVAELLWKLALRLEDGGMSIAERELRRAEERLMDALREGAESAEVEQLLRELEDTLRQFLAEMAQEMMRQGLTEAPIDPNAEFMDTNDLQNMIDRIREMARSGNMEAARQQLAELQRMLQGMRNAMRGGQNNPQQSQQQAAEARELMEALRDLAQRQQELLDQTFQRLRRGQQGGQQGRQGRQGQQGQQGRQQQPGQMGQGQMGQGQRGQGQQMTDAQMQEALRRALGDLMLRFDSLMGQIPGALGEAERAMRRATDALRGQELENAVEAETEALEKLRNGGQQATQQMSQQMGLMPGFMMGNRPMLPLGQRRDRDPFGRRNEDGSSGFSSDPSTPVPDEAQLRRADEILDELRRRSGQRDRPRLELDFIERLLKRF